MWLVAGESVFETFGLTLGGFGRLLAGCLEHCKITKLQECRITIVAGDWWMVAGGSVFEAFWPHFGYALEVFGGPLVQLGSIVFTLGAHLVLLGYFRCLRGHFWYAWGLLWESLEALWVHVEVIWCHFGCLRQLKYRLQAIRLTSRKPMKTDGIC